MRCFPGGIDGKSRANLASARGGEPLKQLSMHGSRKDVITEVVAYGTARLRASDTT